MADNVKVYTGNNLLYTGQGQLVGLVITASAGSPLATFYDNTSAAGTKIFECYVPSTDHVAIFFADRYSPRFSTGLYLALAANLTATVWFRSL